MKLRLITTVLITTLLISCSSFQSEDLKDFNLKGNVKEITNIKFKAIEKFGKIQKDKKIKRTTGDLNENISVKFDTSGFAYESTLFNVYGTLDKKIIRIDTIMDLYNSSGDLVAKTITNNKDFPTESATYDAKGDLMEKTFSIYDDNNNLIDEKSYDNNGDLIKDLESKFNIENELIKEIIFEKKEINSYFGKRDKETNSTVEYNYNLNSEVSEKIITKNNKLNTVRYEYKYDSNNNWIERVKYVNHKVNSIVERKIEYYNK